MLLRGQAITALAGAPEGRSDRAAGLGLTIQIVAKEPRGVAAADESCVANSLLRRVAAGGRKGSSGLTTAGTRNQPRGGAVAGCREHALNGRAGAVAASHRQRARQGAARDGSYHAKPAAGGWVRRLLLGGQRAPGTSRPGKSHNASAVASKVRSHSAHQRWCSLTKLSGNRRVAGPVLSVGR